MIAHGRCNSGPLVGCIPMTERRRDYEFHPDEQPPRQEPPMTRNTSPDRNRAKHEPNAAGRFDLTGLGPIDQCKQVVNNTKFAIILFSKTTGHGRYFRLYEFYRDPETGKVYLPKGCGCSRALYEWLDSRYGVERIEDANEMNRPSDYEYDRDDTEADVALPYQ